MHQLIIVIIILFGPWKEASFSNEVSNQEKNFSLHELGQLLPSTIDEIAAGKVPEALIPYLNQQVIVRGFFYQASNGEAVLAMEPDLKSCCVGATHTLLRQIILEGDFEGSAKKNGVIVFKGLFSISPVIDSSGKLRRLFVLKDSVAMQNNVGTNPGFYWLAIIACTAGVFILICMKQNYLHLSKFWTKRR